MPYEFSYFGMVDRVNTYVQNQDFCNTSHVWPDESIMQPIVAYPGSSCTKQCRSSGILVSDSCMLNWVLNPFIFLFCVIFKLIVSFVFVGYVCERRHFKTVHKAFSGQLPG